MNKVIGLLAAVVVLGVVPAVAFAGSSGGEGDTVSSGNTQNGTIDQGVSGGDGGSGSGGDADGEEGGDGGADAAGGDAGNQAAICQQNAGGDASCSIDQSQSFGGEGSVAGREDGDDHESVNSHEGDDDHDGVVSVDNVRLARTGFDAWVIALAGGVVLAVGIGLLVAQRRGKLNG